MESVVERVFIRPSAMWYKISSEAWLVGTIKYHAIFGLDTYDTVFDSKNKVITVALFWLYYTFLVTFCVLFTYIINVSSLAWGNHMIAQSKWSSLEGYG